MSAPPTQSPPSQPVPPERRRALDDPANRGLLGLLFALVLLGIGWIVVDNLSSATKAEECRMAGGRNCSAPIDTVNP
jgi:hypothetical protein